MRTAVVVGAGVGGLAAAGALAGSGWHVTLLERGDRLRGGGAALLIWPNGVAALRALGVRLEDVAFPVVTGGIRRPDGRWLVEAAPVNGGPPSYPVVVHSDDLHDALMAGLGERIEIRTGMDVTTVRASGARRPGVGTGKHMFEADLIVAADGARSVIRRRLAPEAAVAAAGYTAWRAVIPWFRAPKLPDSLAAAGSARPTPHHDPAKAPAGEMLGAGLRFLYATLGERGSSASNTRGGIYWAATAPGAPRPESASTQLALLRRWFADWHAPVGDLLERTEPQDLVQQAGEELRPLPRRFGFAVESGGFVLLGDAAHVATPDLSQGACLAFEDAVTLRSLLRDPSSVAPLGPALDAYTQIRRARVARVAKASRRLGQVLQARGRLTVRARDAALGRLPHHLLERATASAHQWTPPP